MKFSSTTMVLVLVSCLALGTGIAGAQQGWGQNGSDEGDHTGGVERTVTAATLTPTGEEAGSWGRVMIMDSFWENETRRNGMIHLIGLAPGTDYTVTVSEFETEATYPLAELTTDAVGDGWLRMGDANRNSVDVVPEGLPPAADLGLVTVTETVGGAQVLVGNFIVVSQGGLGQGSMLYMERISLEPAEGTTYRGTARVAQHIDEVLRFSTHACGLTPFDAYTVNVGGIEFTVEACPLGHAALVMSTDGYDDPLPDALQDIENIAEVTVTWFDSDGAPILSGSFTGESMVGSKDPVGGGSGHGGTSGNGGSGGNGGGNGNGGRHGGGQGGGHGGGSK